MRIGIITQVRMTSTRLAGKVLLKALDTPLLKYHLDRLKETGLPIIVATTTNSSDDIIENFCSNENVPCARGSEDDVLSRYLLAAKQYNLDVIIRVTSDCPLIDASLILKGLALYLEAPDSYLYVSNTKTRSFPRGLDYEIFSTKFLNESAVATQEKSDREHVTPYIWMNKSGKTKFKTISHSSDKSNYRITVDTDLDFKLISTLIEKHQAHKLDYNQIIDLLDQDPELAKTNASIEQKKF